MMFLSLSGDLDFLGFYYFRESFIMRFEPYFYFYFCYINIYSSRFVKIDSSRFVKIDSSRFVKNDYN